MKNSYGSTTTNNHDQLLSAIFLVSVGLHENERVKSIGRNGALWICKGLMSNLLPVKWIYNLLPLSWYVLLYLYGAFTIQHANCLDDFLISFVNPSYFYFNNAGTCSVYKSIIFLAGFGFSTLWWPWVSAFWLGHLRPITGHGTKKLYVAPC